VTGYFRLILPVLCHKALQFRFLQTSDQTPHECFPCLEKLEEFLVVRIGDFKPDVGVVPEENFFQQPGLSRIQFNICHDSSPFFFRLSGEVIFIDCPAEAKWSSSCDFIIR
jgi:hypothetical protein